MYSKEPSLKDFSLINIPIFLPLSQLTCSSLTGIKKTNIFKLLPAIKNCQKKSDLLISASKYNYSVFWSEGEITYSITGTNVAYTENFRKENLHKPTSSIDLQVGQTEMGFEGSFNKYGVSYALHSQCSQGNSKCSKKKLREQFKNLYSIITPAFEMLSFGRLLKP